MNTDGVLSMNMVNVFTYFADHQAPACFPDSWNGLSELSGTLTHHQTGCCQYHTRAVFHLKFIGYHILIYYLLD